MAFHTAELTLSVNTTPSFQTWYFMSMELNLKYICSIITPPRHTTARKMKVKMSTAKTRPLLLQCVFKKSLSVTWFYLRMSCSSSSTTQCSRTVFCLATLMVRRTYTNPHKQTHICQMKLTIWLLINCF